MNRFLSATVAILIAAGIAGAQDKPAVAPAAKAHAFMGVKKCSMCHKGEAKGAIFEKWQASAHSHAFANLASPKAAEVYKAKMGKDGNAQTDPACLKCHTTGFGISDTSLTAALVKDDGVTCEACHGPGADYGKMNVMKDKTAAVAAGLTLDPKPNCVKCHNPESPTFKEFKIEAAWPMIAHKIPAPAAQ